MPDHFDYDVAFSFAGEDRHLVEPIVDRLKRRGVNVFYDREKESEMWGRDLVEYLTEVYLKKSRFCVMFVSRAYADKMWTRQERRSALARALEQKTEYVLPIRIDSTELEGILPTVHYIHVRDADADRIVDMILEKLDRPAGSAQTGRTSARRFEIALPKIKKTFSQREKDVFAANAFKTIGDYFQQALGQLAQSDADIETDFDRVHRTKFVCKIYVKGNIANTCKIWLGGMGHSSSDDHLCYSEGRNVTRDSDNSMHEMMSVNSDGHQLGFSGGFMMRVNSPQPESLMTAEAAAASFWDRFIVHLKH